MPRDHGIPLPSEALNPFAARLIGVLGMRCEAVKGTVEMDDACFRLWSTLHALQNIAVCVSTATHFSIAVGNEMRRVADYIKEHLGFDPILDAPPHWKAL